MDDKNMIGKFLTGIAMVVMLQVHTIQALAADTLSSQESRGFAVMGVGALPEFEGAKNFRIVPFGVAQFSAKGIGFELDGLQLRSDFLKDTFWRAGPLVNFVVPRSNSVEEAAVSALPSVDLAIEFGGYIGFKTPFGGLNEGTLSGFISARQDVSGSHDGLLITADVEYFFAINRMLRIGIGANATYTNDSYMETYFSVNNQGSAVSGLAQFEAGSGVKDVGVEIYSILSFNPRWGFFSRVAFNRLLQDAAKSPIVQNAGTRDQLFFGGGVFYRF